MLALVVLASVEPALANKFETISGGVGGSTRAKIEWLQRFLYASGGISLVCAFLAMLTPHANPLLLNFANWKTSAIVLFGLSGACFAVALLI